MAIIPKCSWGLSASSKRTLAKTRVDLGCVCTSIAVYILSIIHSVSLVEFLPAFSVSHLHNNSIILLLILLIHQAYLVVYIGAIVAVLLVPSCNNNMSIFQSYVSEPYHQFSGVYVFTHL